MKAILSALVCGVVFGAGLTISGMTETQKVQGFLDIFGAWDPSLAVVMAAALAVTFLGFVPTRRRATPLFNAQALWPVKKQIDTPIVAGSVLFGLGWGLIGFCPGPAIADIATGAPSVLLFVAAMAIGMLAENLVLRRSVGAEPALEASCG
jgi:hypothetical protein